MASPENELDDDLARTEHGARLLRRDCLVGELSELWCGSLSFFFGRLACGPQRCDTVVDLGSIAPRGDDHVSLIKGGAQLALGGLVLAQCGSHALIASCSRESSA
jgi:hypothetical protein